MRAGEPRPNWYLDPLAAAQKREVHLEWIKRNVRAAAGPRVILKTDLFEEAYGGDELLFSLPLEATLTVGFDLEAATVKKAAARNPSGSRAFLRADVRSLPVADESVDVVLSNSTLDHFNSEQEIQNSLWELSRVLKPGGTLLVTLDNPRNPLFLLFKAAAGRVGLAFSLGKTVTRERLVSMLAGAGLRIESTDWLIHNPRFVSTLLFLALRRTLGRRADGPVRFLLSAFSKMGQLPTREFTAAFSAVCASKPLTSAVQDTLPATESRVSANMKFSPNTCSVLKQPVNRTESAW
jgi:SAM-dependent methyltransferase